jgi:ribonuclease HII
LIRQVTALLFSPAGDDQGQVEITLRDSAKLVKHRRDFLTGAVVEQGVANAIDRIAYHAASHGEAECGLSALDLTQSIYQVVDSLIDNLTPFNVHDYVDLPEQASVGHIRRLPQVNGSLTQLLV